MQRSIDSRCAAVLDSHAPPGDPKVFFTFIDAREIADVAVEALFEQPAAVEASAEPWMLTGDASLGYDEIAGIASRLTGRRIVASRAPA